VISSKINYIPTSSNSKKRLSALSYQTHSQLFFHCNVQECITPHKTRTIPILNYLGTNVRLVHTWPIISHSGSEPASQSVVPSRRRLPLQPLISYYFSLVQASFLTKKWVCLATESLVNASVSKLHLSAEHFLPSKVLAEHLTKFLGYEFKNALQLCKNKYKQLLNYSMWLTYRVIINMYE